MKTETELRELDAWVAEHVMGWSNGEDVGQFEIYPKYKKVWTRYTDTGKAVIFSPSTDRAAAMQVLEKCSQKCTVTIEAGKNQYEANQSMVARLSDHDGSYVEDFCKCSHTLPLAICLFAKALFGGAENIEH